MASHDKSVALPQLPPGPPLVLANRFDGPGIPAVLPDDRRGQNLTARVIAAGHRRIGCLTLREGFEAAALRLGVTARRSPTLMASTTRCSCPPRTSGTATTSARPPGSSPSRAPPSTRLGTIMVYATHSQVEAMMLAARIVVLQGGRGHEGGRAHELCHRPANAFVVGFIGSPPMNVL